ncbi:MAG: hypothetical protein LC674_00350, partial [Actinobacteria bacterium]|nr:hypothetical protein [Actinomycetota bacterium]
VLPPAMRRTIVDLKAEHPPLNLQEIANICGTLFGRRLDGHTVKAMLHPGELLQSHPRQRGDAHAGHERVSLRALRGCRTLRFAQEARHRRRRDLPLPSG